MKYTRVLKTEYVTNIVGLGYAVELLAMVSGLPREAWAAKIAEEANKRFDTLSTEKIERILEICRNERAEGSFTLGTINEDSADAESN